MVQSAYELGNMTRGLQVKHSPFEVSWICNDWNANLFKNTYLTATAMGNKLTDDNNWMYFINKDKQSDNNTAMLSLKANNKYIKLDRSESFCVAEGGTGTCSITPVTDIPKTAKSGRVIATVSFSVSYN